MPSKHLDRRCTDSLRRRARKDRSPFRACALFDSVSVSVSTKALLTRRRVLRVLVCLGVRSTLDTEGVRRGTGI